MKKKIHTSIFPILIMGMFLVLASSCNKDNDKESLLVNTTNGKTSAIFNPNVTYGTMTDQEGNVYKIVTIGTQTWMAENLRTTKYNDGSDIPNVTDNGKWKALKTGAYCTYSNTTNIDTIATYGRLYNWYAVNTKNLAPKGWHVPSDAEWTILTTSLGGEAVAGAKLKEIGTSHWIAPNTGATNETGFTALSGGRRTDLESFLGIGYYGGWWSSAEENAASAWSFRMYYDGNDVSQNDYNKEVGFSIRCIRD